MFKFILRLLGLSALALAVITSVLDLTRSIANSAIVFTPLGVEWANIHLPSQNLLQAITQRYLHPAIWDPVMIWVLLRPAWAVFAVLALIFLFLGRRTERRWQRRFGK